MTNSKMNKTVQCVFLSLFCLVLFLLNSYVYAKESIIVKSEKIVERVKSKTISGMVWKINVNIPVLKGSSQKKEISSINSEIKQYTERYMCEDEGDNHFSFVTTLLNEKFVSFKFEIMLMCSGMPHPESYSDGITFSLDTGKKIKLRKEVKSMNQVEKDVLIKFGSNDNYCSKAEFSGNFFLSESKISFIEFFPEHGDSGCEKEVNIDYPAFSKYLKNGSQLAGLQKVTSSKKSLKLAYAKSLKLYRKKLIDDAIEELSPFFTNNGFKSYNYKEKSTVNIINDYAFFLEQAKKCDESIEILNYIVMKVPDRVVAYINLGDAYFGVDNTEQARQAYQRYVELMKKAGKEKRIPKHVYARLK